MADIFNEIDEELRRDRAAQLWKRYGQSVIAGAVLVVAVSAGYTAWRDYGLRQVQAAGLRFNAAETLSATDKAKAAIQFEALAADPNARGYATLARLRAAELKLATDPAGGLAAIKAIAADSGIEAPYHELALLLAAGAELDTAPPAQSIATLQPIADGGGPWRFTALEYLALAQLKAGDQAAALKSYQRLADDLEAPASQRARATEIVNGLGH